MNELKPCPFCGGIAVVEHWEPSFPDEWYEMSLTSMYDLACSDCGSKTDEYRSKEEAIEAWNMRIEE